MAEEKLLTVRDVSIILGVSEKEILDLAETGAIPTYKIGGVYLRFKRQEIEDFKKTSQRHSQSLPHEKYSRGERISDFFYFNDFYILSLLIIIIIIFIIFR